MQKETTISPTENYRKSWENFKRKTMKKMMKKKKRMKEKREKKGKMGLRKRNLQYKIKESLGEELELSYLREMLLISQKDPRVELKI